MKPDTRILTGIMWLSDRKNNFKMITSKLVK